MIRDDFSKLVLIRLASNLCYYSPLIFCQNIYMGNEIMKFIKYLFFLFKYLYFYYIVFVLSRMRSNIKITSYLQYSTRLN